MQTPRLVGWGKVFASALVLVAGWTIGAEARAETPSVVPAITREVSKPNTDPGGRPLPLAAHWQRGSQPGTYSTAVQVQLVEQGHYLLPNINMLSPGRSYSSEEQQSIATLGDWGMPIAVRGTNWHRDGLSQPQWKNLPPEENPYIYTRSGTVNYSELDPLGPVENWSQAGYWLTDSTTFDQLQSIYPDPPKVLMLSNNETLWIKGNELDNVDSKRFDDAYGLFGHSRDFKNHVIGQGYAERMDAFLQGMNDALTSQTWKDNSFYVGYGNFSPSHYARWGGWKVYSRAGTGVTENDALGNPVHFDAAMMYAHNSWDGGSPSFYLHDWSGITDYQIYSPQVESMNWVFVQEMLKQERPDYWFEMSIWDGGTGKHEWYANHGQTYTPERYGGMVKFGMWLNTPRALREFRGYVEQISTYPGYFDQVMGAVDTLYENTILQRFWRKGELVANPTQDHPYQSDEISEFDDVNRWFLLDADTNLETFTAKETRVPVFSLARVMGEPGSREWLLYAHAPRGDEDPNGPAPVREDVTITIPGYGDVTVDVSINGNYYWIKESDGSIVDPLQFPMILGDLNADNLLNVDDLQPMLLAISDTSSYLGQYVGMDPDAAGDLNNDGKLTVDDLQPFLAALAQGAAIPEPATLALFGAGALALLRRKRSC